MEYTPCLISLLLVAAYLFCPDEFYFYAEKTILQIKVVALNYYLMASAFLMHRKISAEARRMGMPTPAFRFTPIWRRK
jgi:hypothetical protein